MLPILLFACSTESTIPNAEASQNSPVVSLQQTTNRENEEIQNTFDQTQLTVSTKAQLNMAIIEADGKYHTWMEGRSGILRTEPKNSFWLEQGGLSSNMGKGQSHFELDGHSFYTPSKISTVTLASKLEKPPKNTTGWSISLEMTSKGKYISSLTKKDTRSVRLASSINKPSRSAILQVANPEKSLGEPTPVLSPTIIDNIKTTSKLPAEAKKVAQVAPTPEQIKKWNGELKGIFGNVASVGWSTMINLDSDEFVEAIVCTPVPMGKSCFVYDEVKSVGRYYDSGFKWDGKSAPTVFTLNDRPYVYHMFPLKKGAVHKILYFDGSGFTSNQL